MAVFAYVIMPTHVHAIIESSTYPINQIKQAFGSYTAHAITKELINEHRESELDIFRKAVVDTQHKHRVWQEIDSKPLLTEYVLMQEFEYLHNNPVRKKWNLVEDRVDYLYSSAGFYDLGRTGQIEVDDIRLLW